VLADIERWRVALVASMNGRDPGWAERAMVRLLFLRICEDRGVACGLRRARGIADVCEVLEDAARRFDCGLLRLERVAVADAVVCEVVAGLYRFAFAGVAADFLGQVHSRSIAGHKARGVYYTPAYIVDCIVERTVGAALVGRTPAQRGLKVVDPACGSGAFLLGAYRRLLDWYLAWYVQDGPEEWPAEVVFKNGAWRLTAAKRGEILSACIYGVDVDAQAVEVSKLSLLLMVVEGEARLPDLAGVQCGDALIGEELQAGGFDVVVGNPPYVRIHRIGHAEADYLFKKYKTLTSKADLSLAFIEKSLGLVNEGGWIGVVCTSQWLTTDYGRELRRVAAGLVREIVDLGSLPVFNNVNTYPAIVILGRRPVEEMVVRRLTDARELSVAGIEAAAVTKVRCSSLSAAPWRLRGVSVIDGLGRARLAWRPLRAFGKAYIGAKSGLAEAFVVDEEVARGLEPGLLLPYAYQGAEVVRYARVEPQGRIIYPYTRGEDGAPVLIPEATLRGRFPRIHERLSRFEEVLRRRRDSRRMYAAGDDWYRYLRAGSWRYIEAEKLIIKGIAREGTVGVLGSGAAFDGANCPCVILSELHGHHRNYLMALLNSRVVSHYLKSVCPPKLGGYVRFSASCITDAPIRVLDLTLADERGVHDRIVGWVDERMAVVGQGDALEDKAAALERAIEAEVCALYGVSADEVRDD
jgi:methylase of polypeptide subunit release factors